MKKLTLILIALLGIMLIANAQNNALDFDGTNDYVATTPSMTLSGSAVTLEAWINVDVFQASSPNISYLLGIGKSNNICFLRLGDASLDKNKLQFALRIGGANIKLDGTTALETNTWYHVAATYDGTTMKIYVNGILDASASQSGSFTASGNFYLAKSEDYGDRYLDGKMDEARVWNVAHSESEINSLMCFELTGSEDNLVAYYKLNETTGTTASDSQTSGTYNGTLSGTTFDVSNVTSTALITGDGTTNTPYQIAQKNHINWIKNNSTSWDKSFLQIANIDASGTSSWNSGKGLFLIGNSTTKFTGTYDGGGYTISNLSHVASLGNYAGLFGDNNGSTIKNLGLISITITGSTNTGAIAGRLYNSTIISNCYSSGSVQGGQRVGGIAGYMSTSSISGCYSNTTVVGSSEVGGVAGQIYLNSIVSNSYSRGNISAEGSNYGNAGGLVGLLHTAATILNSYSTGTVSVNTGDIGGLVGRAISSVVTNSFWDTETSGQATSHGGTGKTTTQMTTQSTFTNAGWDFTSPIWAIAGGINDGYPNLLNNSIPTSWNGQTSTAWNTTTNWDGLAIPTASDNVSIVEASNNPVINNTGAVCNNLVISTSATLSINEAKDLTVNGNLNNSGTLTINSDASNNGSLIVSGTSAGNVTYNRYMTGASSDPWIWHLISSPVVGQAINASFMTNNSIATNSGKHGLAPYNNTTPGWSHYTVDPAPSITFTSGQGYEIARTSAGTVAFTGTVKTENVSIPITKNTNAWNLVGNPYPSAICANTPASTATTATENIVFKNTAALDDAYEAIYVWDADAGSPAYVTINHSSAATYMAPGQAFFVYSKSGGGTFNFTEAMQTHQTGDIFKSETVENPSIKLFVERSEGTSSTNIKYIEEMTTGLDPGYDAGRFSGGDNSFAVYTHLVGDIENTVDFDIQCLPADEFEHVIPIGLNAPENTEVVFRIQTENLPEDVPVYLEDKLTGEYTALHEAGSFYTVIITEQSEGIGRFYLHTKPVATGISLLDQESVFTIIARPHYNSIRIIGKTDNNTWLAIYDVSGRQLTTNRLTKSETNDVDMAGLRSGIYIVTISSSTQKISKKISWIKSN